MSREYDLHQLEKSYSIVLRRNTKLLDANQRLRRLLRGLAPKGVSYAVVWPYDDCTLLAKGDIVWYKLLPDTSLMWLNSNLEWEPSIRPNILKDTLCSITI